MERHMLAKIAKTFLKKKSLRNHLTSIKTYFIATIIKAVGYWWKDTHIYQWNKIETQK